MFDPILDQQYLQAELTRIDLCIQREARRWQLAGQDPTDAFRGLKITDEEANGLLRRPLGVSWGQTVNMPANELHHWEAARTEAQQAVHTVAENARRQGRPLKLAHLALSLGLKQLDLDAFLICLAPALDVRYERLYGYLQDDVTRKRPSANLILDLLSDAGPDRLQDLTRFGDEAPLMRWRLLERVVESANRATSLSQAFMPDEAVVSWLLGAYQPPYDLRDCLTLQHAQLTPLDSILVDDKFKEWSPALARTAPGDEPILVFTGTDEASHAAGAKWLAADAQRPLLTLNLAAALAAEVPVSLALTLTLRDALLNEAIPYLTGWEACFNQDGEPPVSVVAQVFNHPGLVLIASRKNWQVTGIDRQRRLFRWEFPTPSYSQRQALWQYFLGEEATTFSKEVESLAGQFLLSTWQIRDAVATAQDLAAQRHYALHGEDLFSAARLHSNTHLSGLARKIKPRYTWSDIILPPDQITILHEIVGMVRRRPQVLEEWGVGRKLAASAGITVLFAGSPGTGKTMAAEVIAAQLGLDLYKIDLSSMVSKYIGETEKNLERIFNEAQTSNAILFFDEADSIFGKRSEVKDAHDRYANIEVSYLLQRMEAYDGITILATNLRANLDDAFTRRLQFAIDFPFPDEGDRLRIWQTLFPPGVPRAKDLDLPVLARRYKLAGGNIRNAIVSAAYLAAADTGSVTMQHLQHSVRRELQKMGRLMTEDFIDPR